MKNRDQELQVDERGEPQRTPFDPTDLKAENPN